ncbi:hypothetical protein D3C76_1834880 [compost metagenome]
MDDVERLLIDKLVDLIGGAACLYLHKGAVCDNVTAGACLQHANVDTGAAFTVAGDSI